MTCSSKRAPGRWAGVPRTRGRRADRLVTAKERRRQRRRHTAQAQRARLRKRRQKKPHPEPRPWVAKAFPAKKANAGEVDETRLNPLLTRIQVESRSLLVRWV